jgi:hypothetical protein
MGTGTVPYLVYLGDTAYLCHGVTGIDGLEQTEDVEFCSPSKVCCGMEKGFL